MRSFCGSLTHIRVSCFFQLLDSQLVGLGLHVELLANGAEHSSDAFDVEARPLLRCANLFSGFSSASPATLFISLNTTNWSAVQECSTSLSRALSSERQAPRGKEAICETLMGDDSRPCNGASWALPLQSVLGATQALDRERGTTRIPHSVHRRAAH